MSNVQREYTAAKIDKQVLYDSITFYYTGNGYYKSSKRKYLHIYIYEQYHKCSILPGNEVHHKDLNRFNNDPTNLELLTQADHSRLHLMGHTRSLGIKASEETRKKLSMILIGNTRASGNKGKHKSEETKLKMSISARNRKQKIKENE